MPRRELLARTFPSMNPASAIRKRRTSDPDVPAWCKLTVATWKKGKSHILYQHAIDRYCVEALEVSDHSRRVMTYWDSSTCDLCKDIFPRYTVCRHIARVTDIDAANEGGFLVSCAVPLCASVLVARY